MPAVLSARLLAIADLVPSGARVVDVGTDHALLPIHLLQHGLARSVIATDIAPLPAAAAASHVLVHGLADQIDVRVGPGLQTVHPGEVDTVIAAGMGGATVCGVLADSPKVLDHAEHIVVQPMNLGQRVRLFFVRHGWSLAAERVVCDRGRFYEVMAANRRGGGEQAYAEYNHDPSALSVALQLGPTLLRDPTPEFVRYASQTCARWEQRLQMMRHSPRASVAASARAFALELAWLKDWLEQRRGEEAVTW